MQNDSSGTTQKNLAKPANGDINNDMEKIQQKSRELHGKTRRKLLGTVAGPIVVGLLYALA